MRKFKIEVETYDAPFMLIIGSNEESAKFLNEQQKVLKPDNTYYGDDPNDLGSFHQFLDMLKCGVRRVIWLKQFRKGNIDDMAILVHELQHYTLQTLRDKGMKIDKGYYSDEAYTYLIESLFKKCLKTIK